MWNLAGDVARTTGRPWHHRGRLDRRLYEKLLAGLNILTPPGLWYRPVWSAREHRRLRAVMVDAVGVIGGALDFGTVAEERSE